MGRHDRRIEVDDVLIRLCRANDVTGVGLNSPDLVSEEAENLVILGPSVRVDAGDLFPDAGGLGPLVLVFVQLLQVDERVPVQLIEPNHFLKRLESTIDEPAVTEVQSETEQHIRVLERPEVGALQERLMHIDRPAHLALLPVQIPENHLDLERVSVRAGRLRQLVDGLIHLVVHQKVQPEHVVRGLAEAPSVDPAAIAQLVALPGLADGKADQQRHEYGQKWGVRAHGGFRLQIISVRHRSCRWTTP
jgi:hypothetical protein